ncbi:Na+/H+ antiporter [Asaia lannensis]|uniref:Na+/H+ antiporter n=1 Tax=Asaia lannensis NBRC 102526 TaxID=1307926 RepID=A0ABT1CKU0_9PROT|nr:Na+/H+ antiporter [Asaia lannensis]MCO6160869.1 Na+/H+ antiporter [Asaia lannensis NBRC 102526]GBR01471.1 Na+/H+ antiporter [Asaia lannensis NBRC 102526]
MIPADNILLLLVLAAASGLMARAIRNRMPLPLLQIILGVVAALAGVRIGLRPDLFMLVFLPPLLFADAFRMPLREFHELRGTIFFLAFGLVVLSTVCCGYAIHWLVPTLDLPCCFALAAALSPTDTVAVSGLLAGRHVPERMIHVLSGEALFNDASGLVCFRFATAAALTGEFSYRQAFDEFLLVSLGGLAIGAVIAYVSARLNRILLRRGFDDPPLQITLMILLPFVTYILGERAHCSGILASVSACMVIKMMGMIEETNTATRLQATTVWGMVNYIFNALIFLLLGLQLPALMRGGIATAHEGSISVLQLFGLVLAIYAIMTVLRFAGVWLSIFRRWLVARWMHVPFLWPDFLGSVLLTFAGVRGAVTLAAVLSLPAAGSALGAFPSRELLITVAAGVIVVSLVGAGLLMPLCLRFLPKAGMERHAAEENAARQSLLHTAIDFLHEEKTHIASEPQGQDADKALRLDVIDRLAQVYLNRLSQIEETPQGSLMSRSLSLRRERIELATRLLLLRAQRQTLHRLFVTRGINDQMEWELQQELDFEEQLLRSRVQRLPVDI